MTRASCSFLRILRMLILLAPLHLLAAGPVLDATATTQARAALIERDEARAIRLGEQGQWRRALALWTKIARQAEALHGRDHLETALAIGFLARANAELGLEETARSLGERALSIADGNVGFEHQYVAVILSNLSLTHLALTQYDKALALQQRAVEILKKTRGEADALTAVGLNNLGLVYSALAQHELALPLQQRALSIMEQTKGPEAPLTANVLSNIALTYMELGQPDKALVVQRSAVDVFERTLGSMHPTTGIALHNLAAIYGALREFEKELPLAERALRILELSRGPKHPETAMAMMKLGAAYEGLGRLEKARSLYRRALAIAEVGLGPNHPRTAEGLNLLGQNYVALGQHHRALPLLARALAINEYALGSDHPTTSAVRAMLAVDLRMLDGFPLAIIFLKQSVNSLQLQRGRVASIGAPELRSYTMSIRGWYQILADWLVEDGRLAEAQMVLDMLKENEQFDFIRRSVGADPRRTRIGYNTTEQAWMSRYRQIADRLAALGAEEQALQKQAKVGLTPEQKQRQQAVAADLRVAQAAFTSFLGEMHDDFSRKGAARSVELAESSVKALAELRELLQGLGGDVVLLQFYLTDDQVGVLLTAPGVQIARRSKVSVKELNRQIAEFGRLLRDPKSNPLPVAQALYQLLMAPVAQDLEQAGAKTVMLSLDGALRYLAFGALHDGERYLLQRWSLPIYTRVARERLRDGVAPQWQAAGLGVTRKLGEFDPLPGVKAEMNSIIRNSAGGVLPGEVYLDDAFTGQRLKDVSQRRFPVLHVASHFQFSPGTEVNSFLLLGDGQQLTLGDIRTQNYRFDNVDLLTLSACETGLGGGRDERGREIEGFGVIAQQQGARAVLATLWPVADQSTGILMADMYRRRQEQHLSKVEALRQAQLALQSQARYSHPFYWAPFILMGNWK